MSKGRHDRTTITGMEVTGFFAVRKLDVPGETGVLHIEYDPNVLSFAELSSLLSTDLLVRVVKSWDLLSGGKPVPLTTEAVSALPIVFLRVVSRAIIDDLLGDPKATTPAPES